MSTVIPPWQIPTRRAQVSRTRKYVAMICMERWGGIHFSRSGRAAFIPRKQVTTEWIDASRTTPEAQVLTTYSGPSAAVSRPAPYFQ